jgi:ABC-type multidrug transport system ATPase subunit
VSFALDDQSLLAILGPSGAGKSTLTKALTGYQPATEGRVLYDGRDLYGSLRRAAPACRRTTSCMPS